MSFNLFSLALGGINPDLTGHPALFSVALTGKLVEDQIFFPPVVVPTSIEIRGGGGISGSSYTYKKPEFKVPSLDSIIEGYYYSADTVNITLNFESKIKVLTNSEIIKMDDEELLEIYLGLIR